MNFGKPYSEACERNRGPILEVLREVFSDCREVLEIGTGSGQHAVHFAAHLPHLRWQTSDLSSQHDGILAWLGEARLPNVLPPLTLDINGAWPARQYDAVFTANTLHIVSWSGVERMLAGVAGVLRTQGVLAIYGPFNYGGRYTSDSNARLDAWLRGRDEASGIRGFENVAAVARSYEFELEHDYVMPAHNRLVVWRRLSVGSS